MFLERGARVGGILLLGIRIQRMQLNDQIIHNINYGGYAIEMRPKHTIYSFGLK